MVQLAEVINRPITIEGQEVVLIPDLVGAVPVSEQHQYVELEPATNTCPSISVREADIEDIREQFPELPVYGLWQVLVHSKVISFRHPLHVVKVNEFDGYYLHCDLGRAEFSGVYEAGFFAADSNFDLDEANEVAPAPEDLRLPRTEAKLASELQAERRLKTQRSWKNLGIACVWVVMAGFAVDFGLETFYSREQQKIQTKAAMLESLRSGLDQLRTSRLTEAPNNIEAIKRLAELWATFPLIKTQGASDFSEATFSFRLEDQGFDPAGKLSGIRSRYHPEGYWQLTMNNPTRQ
ncbi:MAG: hypothetical protein R3208_04945 [Ketobacteraceae bacterium]|nr:hypothetical protein [Ketobacteraceae bacterium]